MSSKLRIACIQVNSGKDWKHNLSRIEKLVDRAIKKKAKLIALPETFYARSPRSQLPFLSKHVSPGVIEAYRAKAKKNHVAILLGSLVMPSPSRGKYSNVSILISESGRIAAMYKKIHLFDIGIKGKVVTKESTYSHGGRKVVTGRALGVRMGLSICYDLRFPELYRVFASRDAKIAFVPANFSKPTGEAHWEILLRARAIENQMFIIAPGQSGTHPATKIKSYGHSMVISPWGKVLKRAKSSGEEVLITDLDLRSQEKLRAQFPVLEHRKL